MSMSGLAAGAVAVGANAQIEEPEYQPREYREAFMSGGRVRVRLLGIHGDKCWFEAWRGKLVGHFLPGKIPAFGEPKIFNEYSRQQIKDPRLNGPGIYPIRGLRIIIMGRGSEPMFWTRVVDSVEIEYLPMGLSTKDRLFSRWYR